GSIRGGTAGSASSASAIRADTCATGSEARAAEKVELARCKNPSIAPPAVLPTPTASRRALTCQSSLAPRKVDVARPTRKRRCHGEAGDHRDGCPDRNDLEEDQHDSSAPGRGGFGTCCGVLARPTGRVFNRHRRTSMMRDRGACFGIDSLGCWPPLKQIERSRLRCMRRGASERYQLIRAPPSPARSPPTTPSAAPARWRVAVSDNSHPTFHLQFRPISLPSD